MSGFFKNLRAAFGLPLGEGTGRRLHSGGFSLVELMVAIAVVGILIKIATVKYDQFKIKTEVMEVKTTITKMMKLMEVCRVMNDQPTWGDSPYDGGVWCRFVSTFPPPWGITPADNIGWEDNPKSRFMYVAEPYGSCAAKGPSGNPLFGCNLTIEVYYRADDGASGFYFSIYNIENQGGTIDDFYGFGRFVDTVNPNSVYNSFKNL